MSVQSESTVTLSTQTMAHTEGQGRTDSVLPEQLAAATKAALSVITGGNDKRASESSESQQSLKSIPKTAQEPFPDAPSGLLVCSSPTASPLEARPRSASVATTGLPPIPPVAPVPMETQLYRFQSNMARADPRMRMRTRTNSSALASRAQREKNKENEEFVRLGMRLLCGRYLGCEMEAGEHELTAQNEEFGTIKIHCQVFTDEQGRVTDIKVYSEKTRSAMTSPAPSIRGVKATIPEVVEGATESKSAPSKPKYAAPDGAWDLNMEALQKYGAMVDCDKLLPPRPPRAPKPKAAPIMTGVAAPEAANEGKSVWRRIKDRALRVGV